MKGMILLGREGEIIPLPKEQGARNTSFQWYVCPLGARIRRVRCGKKGSRSWLLAGRSHRVREAQNCVSRRHSNSPPRVNANCDARTLGSCRYFLSCGRRSECVYRTAEASLLSGPPRWRIAGHPGTFGLLDCGMLTATIDHY